MTILGFKPFRGRPKARYVRPFLRNRSGLLNLPSEYLAFLESLRPGDKIDLCTFDAATFKRFVPQYMRSHRGVEILVELVVETEEGYCGHVVSCGIEPAKRAQDAYVCT